MKKSLKTVCIQLIEDFKEEINKSFKSRKNKNKQQKEKKSYLRRVKENRINKKNPKQGDSVSENLEIKRGTALAMFTDRIRDVREKSQM